MKFCVVLLFGFMSCIYAQSTNTTYLEELFLSIPNATILRDNLEYYTSEPNLAGSTRDYDTALWTQNQFLSFGFSAVIEEEEALLNVPISRSVAIVNGDTVLFSARLDEPDVPVDPTSNATGIVPTFFGYGVSGNVTADVVYANYGTLEDFEQLISLGVEVEGKIVIVRYGQIFRGLKVMIAQKYGAVGVLIYSDPQQDGFVKGAVYPVGPWRPEYGVQRGSVQFMSVCPGDVRRVEICLGNASLPYEGNLIPDIPAQPLSWGDAYPILSALTGIEAPDTWQGGLNFTYNIGGTGNLNVNLEVQVNFNATPIWNVIATLEGLDTNHSVIVGNHRDAWVFGSPDPASGSSILLEIARAFGELAKTGWKPQRNLVLASWDAEEYGLVGSTAYVEKHASQLYNTTVAYLNIDSGVGGTSFHASGTQSLYDVLYGVTSVVAYPGNPAVNISQNWGASNFSVLGAGSDYVAFIDSLGIPSLDLGFGGISGGVYHSIYGSLYWMENFGDPSFAYHVALAQTLGLTALRLVDQQVLPLNFSHYGVQLENYIQELDTIITNVTKDINLSPLSSAASSFSSAGNNIESVKTGLYDDLLASPTENFVDRINSLTNKLVLAERQFLNPEGLPGRPFFKHILQAPGLYLGYGSQLFPGVQQAFDAGNYTLAQQQVEIAAARINAVANYLGVPNSTEEDNLTWLWIVLAVVGAIVLITIVILVVQRMKRKEYTKV